jgi:hypothetical protein
MTVYHTNVATLHITNGSCAGDKLKTFVDGPVVLMADVLHDGPAPRLDGDAWYDARARHLGSDTEGPYVPGEVRAELAESDQAIARALARGDDLVLWFEHDLFDQLLLIRTLDLIGRANRPGAGQTVSLICIDRFPGVERFIGLGQLDPEQLASLWPYRQAVTAEQFAVASEAWDAFRRPEPGRLVEITDDVDALPFLGDALRRFLAEYPSVHNGLTRTEELALTALSRGSCDPARLFAATQNEEPRPFMGDLTFFAILRALGAAPVPLVSIDPAPRDWDLRGHTVAITDAGRDVLAGRRDRVALNGIDLWRGGVHLDGTARTLWRWDARRETLVS